jgi:hypothetical protein
VISLFAGLEKEEVEMVPPVGISQKKGLSKESFTSNPYQTGIIELIVSMVVQVLNKVMK